MKITIEPEEGETFKGNVYEHVAEVCVVGMRKGEFGMVPIRRMHTNPMDVYGLVGLLEAAKQELLASARRPHSHCQEDNGETIPVFAEPGTVGE